MDDKAKGVSHERAVGRGDDGRTGRAGRATPRARSSTGATGETRSWSEEGIGSPTVTEREGESDPRARQIRAEIEQTREDMSETVDAIQDRLRPGNLAANAAAGVRDAASAAAASVRSAASDTMDDVAESRVVQQARANPIPAAMVGIGLVGLGWLAFGNRTGRSQARQAPRFTAAGFEERDDDFTTSEPGTVGAAGELASRTGEYAREVGPKARQATRRAQTQLQRAINENPLFVGAAALAAGAMIGMALPETERENELMGDTRDSVVEGAQEMARSAANRVQQAATDAAKHVQDAATEAVGVVSSDQ